MTIWSVLDDRPPHRRRQGSQGPRDGGQVIVERPRGFTNHDLPDHLDPLLGRSPGTTRGGQATYDLRRLRHTGRVEMITG